MAKGIPSFSGTRLRQARQARGLSGVNLAALLNTPEFAVSTSTISQYEHGETKPPAETVERLAKALNVPKPFFLRPPFEYKTPRFFYRSMSSATKMARNRAESRFEWLREIAAYFEEYFDLPEVNLPKFDLPSSFDLITEDFIDKCAAECRRHWGLKDGPIPNMVRLLEKNGVVVSRFRLEAESLDAFSEVDSDQRPFVILNADKESCARSRFDAAHELAHIIFHHGVEQRHLLSTQEHAKLEAQAHRFAVAFLLPESDFCRELAAPTLESFCALKERWRVSIAAMIVRCKQLGMLGPQHYERLWMNLGRRGWRKCEPLDDQLQIEQPRLIRQCVDMMVDARFKSRQQIAEDLCLFSADIEDLGGLPAGFLNDGFGDIITLEFKNQDSAKPQSEGSLGDVVPFKFA